MHDFIDADDTQLAKVQVAYNKVHEPDSEYPIQVAVIDVTTTKGHFFSLTKYYRTIELRKGRQFKKWDAPEQMSVEEIFQYVGFTVQEGVEA